MTSVRFLSPRTPDLVLPAVPATFTGGVCDIDDSRADVLGRMRYLGVPHGVIEIGELSGERVVSSTESEPRIGREDTGVGSVPVLQSDNTATFRRIIGGPGINVTIDERGNLVISVKDN